MQEMALRMNSSLTSRVRLSMALTSVYIKSYTALLSYNKFLCAYYSSVDRFAISFTILVIASSMFPALNSSYFFSFYSFEPSFAVGCPFMSRSK